MTVAAERVSSDNIPADRVRVLDHGDTVADRYTAVIDGEYECAIFMSENPFHPQGFGQHGEVSREWFDGESKKYAVDVASLPPKVRTMIARDLNWALDHPNG